MNVTRMQNPFRPAAARRLDALEKAAVSRGDEAALSVVSTARAISEAVPARSEARTKIAEAAARAIQAAPASAVGAQARIAVEILDSVDGSWPTLAAMNDGARRAVGAVADRAAATGAPEARNARFLADMVGSVDFMPQSVLSRMKEIVPADVDRLGWYVDAAESGALDGISTVGGEERGARVVDMGLDEVRRAGGHPHLARMEAMEAKVSSPIGKTMVRYETLNMIHNQVPVGPEAGLVLAHKIGTHSRVPVEERAAVRQAAVDEALPTATGDLRRWLEFHNALQAVPNREQMQNLVLYCCVLWGAPAEPRYLDFALYQALREVEPAHRKDLFDALKVLSGPSDWRTTVERYVGLAQECEKRAPSCEVPMLELALEGARTSPDPSVKLLLETIDKPLEGMDRRNQLKTGLQRILAVGHDKMQDALTREIPDPGGVTTTSDYVMIGTLRVPRRAVT
jgi:hypothetical protein